jgi:hypothetical protein
LTNDVAFLYDSSGDDESIRRYDYVNLCNDDYFHRAKYFESMTVSGNGGDDDTAILPPLPFTLNLYGPCDQ